MDYCDCIVFFEELCKICDDLWVFVCEIGIVIVWDESLCELDFVFVVEEGVCVVVIKFMFMGSLEKVCE